MRECILLVDDDRLITDGLAVLLERPGRTTIVCSDTAAAEIALGRFPVTHVISDVQFSGAFGFEGLHFVERIRAQAPRCRIILMSGAASEALRREALSRGVSAVLAKPFDIEVLEAALAAAHAPEQASYEIVRIPAIEEILTGDALDTVFQPIVRLTSEGASTVAFEALTRVRGGAFPGGPLMLLDYAARTARLAELNVAMVQRAIAAAGELPGQAALFVNVDPVAFEWADFAPAVERAAAAAGVSPSRLVVEVTERSAFLDRDSAARSFETLRQAGVRFALDDQASAYSHLSLLDAIRPSFIKVSSGFGTGFEQDETKRRIVQHLVALARDLGCESIVEGIETAATAEAAAAAGASLVQGYHFSRPQDAAHWKDHAGSAAPAA